MANYREDAHPEPPRALPHVVRDNQILYPITIDRSILELTNTKSVMPTDPAERKEIPMASGLLDYFPGALAEVARVSLIATKQHHQGENMHWDRSKSTDHADTIIRHLADRGTIDPVDGVRHSAKVAWRALALLQEELEAEGANPGRASVFPPQPGQVVEVPASKAESYRYTDDYTGNGWTH